MQTQKSDKLTGESSYELLAMSYKLFYFDSR